MHFLHLLLMSLVFSVTTYAEDIDPQSKKVLEELENYCNEIPNHMSYFQDNLDNGSIKSVKIEKEPGVIKHDIFIQIDTGDEPQFISCHQNFNTKLLDQSLHDLRALQISQGLDGVACIEQDGSSAPAGQNLEEEVAGLQAVSDKAMCEINQQTSMGDCTRSMTYCGLDNLNLAGVLKMEKPKGANCSGLLSGAVGAYADAGQCMATFIRGAFNEITDTLKFLVVEGPTWLYDKTFGSWFGEPAVEQMENVESLEAIASSIATDEEIEQEQNEPEKSFVDKIVAFTENLFLQKGVENFGCESWSSGVPGVGTCLNPPASWECASCKQKAMAICGVAGYATGMVVETAVLATPVGVVAGTITGLAKANKASKAGKALTAAGNSKAAAAITKGSVAVGKAGLAVLAPIAKAGFAVGKTSLEFLKLIPGATLTAKALAAPIKGFIKADDFLTSKAWNLSYHGTKAYTQALSKTGNVQVAYKAAQTATKVSQTQKAGSQLLQTQSEIRLSADKAKDPKVSKAEQAKAKKKQAELTAKMRKQEAKYTELRESIRPDDLEGSHMVASDHAVELANKYKAQDEQILADMYQYGMNHVQKMETLMPESGLILKLDDSNKIQVQVNPGDEYTDYLETIQKVADEAEINDIETLRQFAYLPTDQLHLFRESYPNYKDPMDVLTKIYKKKYSSHLSRVTDPIDQENVVKIIRELELRHKSSSEISSKLDEVVNICTLKS